MTRQQRWALEAHKHIQRFRVVGDQKKLNTFCQKFPSLIQQAGLIQALVFVEARGKDSGAQFLEALAKCFDSNSGMVALRTKVQQASMPEYLALSRDLTEVAVWFRRFAQIELGDAED